MRTLKISLLVFILSITISAQWSFEWAQRAGGTSDDSGQCISIDASGNSYVTGSFKGTAMFGTIQLVANGFYDFFIAKYDANGNCLWAKNAGSNYFDYGYGISTDANGNSYVTGSFEQTITFGTIQLNSIGSNDIFIAKYDSIGNCVWAKNAGGIDYDQGVSISIDKNGNLCITGSFEGTAVFGTVQVVSSGINDVFVAKCDTSGNFTWVRKLGGTNSYSDYGKSISIGLNGNIYITGTFIENPLPQSYDADIFIAKYDLIGNLKWVETVTGNSDASGQSISIDAYGNTYVTGYFSNSVVFGSIYLYSNGYKDIFVAKYDSSGNCVWAKKHGGSENDYGGFGISTDSTGNSYIAGSIYRTNTLSNDIIIANYGASGNLIWAIEVGGSNYESDEGLGIATDGYGNLYVTGYFRGSAMFDTTQLVSAGGKDIFITKINTPVTALEENLIPSEIQLHQNYPNPFNPSTNIKFRIADFGFVSLKVYDILGREVVTLVNEEKPAGEYEVEFDAANLPSGIYFYQLRAGQYSETKKMILLK